jgi:hypothetical protein
MIPPEISLHVSDWVAIALYIAVTFGVALRVRLGQKNEAD